MPPYDDLDYNPFECELEQALQDCGLMTDGEFYACGKDGSEECLRCLFHGDVGCPVEEQGKGDGGTEQ